MSNTPFTQKPSSVAAEIPEISAEAHRTTPDVRKVLGAYAEREVQRIRWSAVIAGLFLALGAQILLGLLGIAVGLTPLDIDTQSPFVGFGIGAGIWTAFVALTSLFV